MAAGGTADYAEIRNTDLQVVQIDGFQVREPLGYLPCKRDMEWRSATRRQRCRTLDIRR